MIMIRKLRLASTSALILLAVGGSLLWSTTKVGVAAQDAVNYTHDGDFLQGYIFYPDLEAIGEADVNGGNVPLVVVVPYVLPFCFSIALVVVADRTFLTAFLLVLSSLCNPATLRASASTNL